MDTEPIYVDTEIKQKFVAPYSPSGLPGGAPGSPPGGGPGALPLDAPASPPPNAAARVIDVEAREVEPPDPLLSDLEEIRGGDGKKISVYRYTACPWDQTPTVTGRLALSAKHTASIGSYDLPAAITGKVDLEDFLYSLFGAGNYVVQIREGGRLKSQPYNLRLCPRPNATGQAGNALAPTARPTEIDDEMRLLEARSRVQETMLNSLLGTLNGVAEFTKIQNSLAPRPTAQPLPPTREAALYALASEGDMALKARVIEALVAPPPASPASLSFLDRVGDFLFRFLENNGEQILKTLGPVIAAAAAPQPSAGAPRRRVVASPPQSPQSPPKISNLAPQGEMNANPMPTPTETTTMQDSTPTAPDETAAPQSPTDALIEQLLDLAELNGRMSAGERFEDLPDWTEDLETQMATSAAQSIKATYDGAAADPTFQANIAIFAVSPVGLVIKKLQGEYGEDVTQIARLQEFVGKIQAQLRPLL